MFGPHLIVEGYNCKNKESLASEETVKRMLTELPDVMDMTIIMQPQIMHYDGGELPEDKGVSGFVIIAESHLAIHTFPEKGFFTLDIFSCKPFDEQKAIDYVNNLFVPESHEHKLLERGREFPRCIARSSDIVDKERLTTVAK